MSVRVQSEDFDIAFEIARLREASGGEIPGAVVTFTGLVRDFYDGRSVKSLTLEHYAGMTERELEGIVARAKERWPLGRAVIIHRVGKLSAGENIVFVGCVSRHREAAFEAARFMMDYLKTDAPFWKAEETEDGVSWVEARDSDRASRARWEE